MKKQLGAVLLTLALSAAASVTVWAGWETDGTSWWYNYDEGGYASSGIRTIDGLNYCFDANGYMLTGWQYVNFKWYYFDPVSGTKVYGWQFINGNWYYLNPNSDGTRGRMLTGWFQDVDGSWYYLNPNSDGTRGRMMTGWNWIKDGDGVTRCYYLNPNADGTRGKMAANTPLSGPYNVALSQTGRCCSAKYPLPSIPKISAVRYIIGIHNKEAV